MRVRQNIKNLAIVAAALLMTSAATSAVAQASSASGMKVTAERPSTPAVEFINEPFNINLGAFVVASKIDGSLRGNAAGAGQDIDFGRDFGTDADQTRYRLDGLWRINKRHFVRLMYFNNDITKTRKIDRDIAWGDYTFLANGEVTAETKFQIYELAYEYAFIREPTYEVVGTGGVHYDKLTIQLAGQATVTVNGVTQPANFESKSSSVPAPLPVLGLRGAWAVSDHIVLDGTGQVFKVHIGSVNGNWSELRLNATWMFTRNFGIGAGYDRFATHVDVSKANFNGRLNLGYQGALIFLTGGF